MLRKWPAKITVEKKILNPIMLKVFLLAKSTSMKTQLKSIIKVEIEQIFGRRVISSRDCIELSEDIYCKVSERLNQNTLRRFFGLIKSEYPPSQYTLSILSKYCGFETLDDAYNARQQNPDSDETVSIESISRYLVSIFKDISVKDIHGRTLIHLVKHAIQFINTSESLADKFQNQIVRTSNGSNIYFEQMVNIDKLNAYYGRALRYYLKEKGTVEAEMFASSLYVIRHWLNEEDDSLEKAAFVLVNEKVPSFKSPAMYARYFAAVILYNHASGLNSDAIKAKLKEYYDVLEAGTENSGDLFSYCYIIAEAFALTGQHSDALYYIVNAPEMKMDDQQDQSVSYIQSMSLLHSYSLYKLGEMQEAEKMLITIKPSDFYFLQKKFCNVLYLYLLKEMKHNGKKYAEELLCQIEETGFKRLKKLLF